MRRRSRVNYKHGQVYHIMEWLNDLWRTFSYLDCKRSIFVPAKMLIWKFIRSSFVRFLALSSHIRRLSCLLLYGSFNFHLALTFCRLLLFGPISIWSSLYFMSCFSRQYFLKWFLGFYFTCLFMKILKVYMMYYWFGNMWSHSFFILV